MAADLGGFCFGGSDGESESSYDSANAGDSLFVHVSESMSEGEKEVSVDPKLTLGDNGATADSGVASPALDGTLKSGTRADVGTAKRSTGFDDGSIATPRPITLDYDSTDARLVELKRAGHSDAYVANKLKEEGRVKYLPKTVSSRWLRLRKVVEKAEEERLDDELSDWHVGDDDLLIDSINKAQEKYEAEIKKLEEAKWKDVAAILAHRLEKKKYTANACHQRYNGLQDGTALLPLERDPDQEGRRILRETRIANAKQNRTQSNAEKKRIEMEQQQRRNERQTAQEEKNRKRDTQKSRREEARARSDQARIEKKTNRAKARIAKETGLAKARKETADKKKERDKMDAIYRDLTGKPLLRHRSNPIARRFVPKVGDDSVMNDRPDGISKAPVMPEMDNNASDTYGDDEASYVHISDTEDTQGDQPDDDRWTMADLTHNPRAIMTRAELEILLFQRGLPAATSRESNMSIVERLAVADGKLTHAQLDQILGQTTPQNGGKTEEDQKTKITRLQQKDALESAAGAIGLANLEGDLIEAGNTGKLSGRMVHRSWPDGDARNELF